LFCGDGGFGMLGRKVGYLGWRVEVMGWASFVKGEIG